MYRKYALKMFIRIFPIFEVSDLPALKPILQTVVPWVRFSNDQEEKRLFLLIVHDICPIVDPEEPMGNVDDAAAELAVFLTALNSNWSSKREMCSKILIDSVLIVFMKDSGMKVGYRVHQYGFNSPVPVALVDAFLVFFQQFVEFENDFQLVTNDSKMISMIVMMLHEYVKDVNVKREYCITAIHALTALMRQIKDINQMLKNSREALLGMVEVLSMVLHSQCNVTDKGNTYAIMFAVAEGFARCFFEVMPVEGVKDFYLEMFKRIKLSYLCVSFLYVHLLDRVMKLEKTSELWQTLRTIQASDPVIAAHGGIYAQYLALLSFGQVFGIDSELLRKECERISRKRSRIHSTKEDNWFYESVDPILEQPHMCVRKELQFDKDFVALVPVPRLNYSGNVLDQINIFLDTFSEFGGDSEKNYDMYLPVLAYLYALFYIPVPPSVKRDYEKFTAITYERIMHAINDQDDFKLKHKAFLVLAPVMGKRETKQYLREEQINSWYVVLIAFMLSKDPKLSQYACKEALRSIMICHKSSQILVMILRKLIKASKLSIDDAYFGLLCSIPIMTSYVKIPWKLNDALKKFISKDPSQFMDDCADFLSDTEEPYETKPLIESDCPIIPQLFLACELHTKKPNPANIEMYLNVLLDRNVIGYVFPFCGVLCSQFAPTLLNFLTSCIAKAESDESMILDTTRLAILAFDATPTEAQYRRLLELLRSKHRKRELDMLSTLYGHYPICSCDSDVTSRYAFGTPETSMFQFTKDEMIVMKPDMRIKWSYKEVSNPVEKMKKAPDVSFESTIPAKTARSQKQIKFSNTFDQVIAKVQTKPLVTPPREKFPELAPSYAQVNEERAEPSSVTVGSAAFLTSLGIADVNRPSLLPSVFTETQRYEILKAILYESVSQAIRVVVLYQSKDKSVYEVKMNETSGHFREFVSGLGLFKKKDHSMFFDGFNNEFLLGVPPMMEEGDEAKQRATLGVPMAIVWCDDNMDISPVPSQINVVTIGIYPLKTALFCVEIVSERQTLEDLGLPFKSLIVEKGVLPVLVRSICIRCAESLSKKMQKQRIGSDAPVHQSESQEVMSQAQYSPFIDLMST